MTLKGTSILSLPGTRTYCRRGDDILSGQKDGEKCSETLPSGHDVTTVDMVNRSCGYLHKT